MFPNDDNIRSFPVSSLSAGKFLRVALSAGVLALAGAGDFELGTTNAIVYSTDAVAPVWLRRSEGTEIFIANAAVTAGNQVYAAASGKVAPTGFILIGTALTAATADGDQIEVLRQNGGVDSVAAVAAAGSVQSDAGSLTALTNVVSAADATKGVILPTAFSGLRITVKNNVNAVLKVYPATGGTINALSANAAISQAALTNAIFVATSTTQWYTIPLLPS